MSELKEIVIDPKKLRILIDELSGISDADFSKIINCLESSKPFKEEPDFINSLNHEKVGLSNIDKSNLLELLEILYIINRKLGTVSSEQVIDFVFGIKRDPGTDFRKNNQRIKDLQRVTISVNLIAKSKDLWKELPRKLYAAMILTDFRPFFSDGIYVPSQYGPSDGPMIVENGCIVHTLKLSYEEDGIVKQFHVSLDKKSLWKMHEEIARALSKEDSLETMMKKIDVQIHESKP